MIQSLLSSAPWWAWLGFHVLVLAMLVLDLGVWNRQAHAPSMREATIWSAVWVFLAVLFAGLIWKFMGSHKAAEFGAGYLIEKSLSVDNLFVFIMLFTAFQVPAKNQHRILFWGVVGAMVMRAVMIGAGIALLNRFHGLMVVFGAFLIYTGVKMLFTHEEEPADPRRGWVAKLFQRLVPYDPEGGYGRLWTPGQPRRRATPMLLVLVLVEVTDLLFAVDSIPAVLAVTRDPFLVYTSNIFAILGLRSLYFLLAGMMDRFHLLKVGLAIILAYVGVKMGLSLFVEIPVLVSLLVIALILGACIIASLIWPKPQKGAN